MVARLSSANRRQRRRGNKAIHDLDCRGGVRDGAVAESRA